MAPTGMFSHDKPHIMFFGFLKPVSFKNNIYFQHKYDFLYKVLDSAVLDASKRESRRKSRSPERPRTSIKSPQRSATARKPNERAKSGLVRPSYSPKRDRRTNRRAGSPTLDRRRKKDER